MDENREAAQTLFVCNGGNGWHHFMENCADPRNGKNNPKVRFHMYCRKCTARLIQEISYELQPDGSEIPVMVMYLMVDGRTWTIPASTYKVLKRNFTIGGQETDGTSG